MNALTRELLDRRLQTGQTIQSILPRRLERFNLRDSLKHFLSFVIVFQILFSNFPNVGFVIFKVGSLDFDGVVRGFDCFAKLFKDILY